MNLLEPRTCKILYLNCTTHCFWSLLDFTVGKMQPGDDTYVEIMLNTPKWDALIKCM